MKRYTIWAEDDDGKLTGILCTTADNATEGKNQFDIDTDFYYKNNNRYICTFGHQPESDTIFPSWIQSKITSP